MSNAWMMDVNAVSQMFHNMTHWPRRADGALTSSRHHRKDNGLWHEHHDGPRYHPRERVQQGDTRVLGTGGHALAPGDQEE